MAAGTFCLESSSSAFVSHTNDFWKLGMTAVRLSLTLCSPASLRLNEHYWELGIAAGRFWLKSTFPAFVREAISPSLSKNVKTQALKLSKKFGFE